MANEPSDPDGVYAAEEDSEKNRTFGVRGSPGIRTGIARSCCMLHCAVHINKKFLCLTRVNSRTVLMLSLTTVVFIF